LFGDLADDAVFSAAFTDALTSLRTRGTRATVRQVTGSGGNEGTHPA
jgi:hypothetical protein